MIKPPILVTGSHRSGSTWVGKILSASPTSYFVGEPFNLTQAKQYNRVPITYWFHAVTPQSDKQFYLYLTHKLGITYRPYFLPNWIPQWKIGYFHGSNYVRCFTRHLMNYQPIVKDPIAFFSAEWFAQRFQAKVLILIRHPAAFVDSLKRANWTFPFDHFLQQSRLMDQMLSGFSQDIQTYANQPPDIIDQGILLWRIFHTTITHYQRQHPEWFFVRHEDLSRSPMTAFQNLFQQLDLPFTQAVQTAIETYTSSERSASDVVSYHRLHRDSRANIWAWRSHLSASEIGRIQDGVSDISCHFYSEQDWFPDHNLVEDI